MHYNHYICLVLILSKQHSEKVKDATMSRSNHMEPNKITLVGWVNQALKQSFIKQNIKSRLGLHVYGL
jgi:hypothetical protein